MTRHFEWDDYHDLKGVPPEVLAAEARHRGTDNGAHHRPWSGEPAGDGGPSSTDPDVLLAAHLRKKNTDPLSAFEKKADEQLAADLDAGITPAMEGQALLDLMMAAGRRGDGASAELRRLTEFRAMP